MQLRVIIRKDFLEGEAFDSILYADLIFVENVTHYFLDLIQSPRNPMQHKLLERSAAIHASIFILNTLFVSVNDKIDLQWIERQATETGPRKWDSIAFTRSKNALDAVLIEFSGDRHLLFEGVKSLNDQLHLKKKYADILCPATPSELKECAKLLPVLFAWKQAVLDVITDLT
ncbi:hypothetical protein BDC45DRAFT_461847 [Circinella umbellata]|nr:hypothetical protein BDC45DRAFT_461847 [Circinella umbellata]